ncbi:nitrate- and nitrite sensing domain-containing protein [Streptomyces sp. FH025]|nr:nitrate- and nitrite sensing domain-containing protein [Streptomyces sp. FH025]
MRNWRIRTRLIALLALPVLVSLVLGGLRIQTSLENSQQLAQMANLSDLAKKATNLADALQTERDISAGYITNRPNDPLDDEIVTARKATDDLSRTFTASSDKFENLELSGGKALLFQLRRDLNSIADARNTPYQNNQNIQATITAYDVIIRDLLSITQDIALASDNKDLLVSTRALQQFSLAKNATSQQRALISAGLANPKGPDLSASDESFGVRLRASYDNALTSFNNIYTSHDLDNLRGQLSYNSVVADADRYARSILQPSGIHQTEVVSYKDWYEKASAKITAERRIESKLIEDLDGKAQDLQSQADTEAIIIGAAIALVLLFALGGAGLIARSMVRSLTRLQAAAEDVAERRLPELVKTLSENDPHDVDTTVEPVAVDSTDEIGHVAHAFDMVHSEAVRLAAEQALLRGNINAMFTNLSRRSQGLIQRQLSLISELESREADPDQLANLFKLDHLATRMRRNGENLLVLAGEDPGRRWTRPVPLVDVLRAAASEVEQYERIELAAVPSAEVAGRVVNDLVHLLAELLENATSFSSPQTRVRVTGHALPDGRVLVEIHDTGIGLSPDDLAEINERLANPPTVDVSVSRRMGLFVVGRLSLRHGIRIQLRPSDSGGTTALVMLPVDVTNSAERRGPGRSGSGSGSGQGKQQRGVAPTPRQQRQVPPGRQGGPAALGQGPAGGAPQGGRPQLGQGGPAAPASPAAAGAPTAPAAPAAPAGPGAPGGRAGGLPTRQVGKALRENPMPQGRQNQQQPQGRQPQNQPQAQSQGQPQGQGQGQQSPQAGLPQRAPGRQGPGAPGQQGPQGPQGPQGQRRPQRPGPEAPQRDRQPQLPPQQQAQPLPPAEPAPVESTQQFARPRFEASQIDPRDPLGLGLVEPVLPNVPNPPQPQVRPEQAPAPQQQVPPRQEPMALPTGPSEATGEQPWPPQQPEGQPQARPRPYQPRRPGTSAPEFQPEFQEQAQPPRAPQQQAQPQPAQPQPQQPQQPQVQPPQPGVGDAPWRPSANDERWRRAEQIREPSTSGVTMSGLPRRTPQANLVSGTAEASPLTGPQVSRAPEEVRGRLTNLRRGIQQGRRAGAEQAANQPGVQHGAQQPGFDSFGGRNDGNGADHQER